MQTDDQAGLCIDCGGYNRRVRGIGSALQGVSRLGLAITFLLDVVAPVIVIALMTWLWWRA